MNIQKYLDLFEYKLRDDKDKDSGFWSFKMDAIVSSNADYRKMSDLIHNAEIAQDYAYTFTIEALEAIKSEELSYIEEHFHEYSESPVYTSELLAWFSAGTSHITYVEEAMDEYGSQNQDGKTDLIYSIRLGYSRAWEAHYFEVLAAITEEDKETKSMQQFA